MVKELSKEKYWQVVGLLSLAATTLSRLNEIEKSLHCVLEVDPKDEAVSGVGDPEHIGDATHTGYSADELLEKLGVTLLSDPCKTEAPVEQPH